MRPFRQDLVGRTDANGNASITVPMPQTGEWHDLKFALGTVAPAEWSITVSGTVVTYGRGRRVTLGPELVQDHETVILGVSGGPVNAPISGSANGRSGSPGEILAGFVPQPNTIALDTAPLILLTDRIDTAAGTGSKSYPMPPGAQSVMVGIDKDDAAVGGPPNRTVNPTQIDVFGFPSGLDYILLGGTALNLNPAPLGLIDVHDTQFTVSWTSAGANPLNVFLDVVVTGTILTRPQNVAFQFYGPNLNLGVTEEAANPASWQAAGVSGAVGIGVVPAGTTNTIIGGSAGLITRLYRVRLGVVASAGSSITVECPIGTVRANIDASRTQDFDGDFDKLPCGVNAALAYTVHGANANVSGGFGTVSQA